MMFRALPILLLLASRAIADGFSSMPLRDVLLETDTIVLAEILQNNATTTQRKEGNAAFRECVIYANDIRTRVIGTHLGTFTSTEYNTKYSLTLVKGVWLGIPGSGLERRMAPGEEYVLLLRRVDGGYTLQRAEKGEDLEKVLRIRKELDDEDRRVAAAQARIPNGIYHYSDAAETQKVRLEDGRRVTIGDQCDFDIVLKELQPRYNLTLLSLTVDSGKPGRCILMVDGKAHWLFDHHWAANANDAGAEHTARLYCSLNDKSDAEAVGKFLGITIVDQGAKKVEDQKKE